MGVGTPICFHLVPVISLNPHVAGGSEQLPSPLHWEVGERVGGQVRQWGVGGRLPGGVAGGPHADF